MQKLLAGLILGAAAALWAGVYAWVGDPHVQALMIIIGIFSGVRVAVTSEVEQNAERYYD